MTKLKKIKAGALQFVLFIGAIIAVLLMAFVMVSHSHTLFNKKTDITIAMIQATDRGMGASFDQPLEVGMTWELPERDPLGIETSVQKDYWGLLEKREVISKKGKLKFTKIGLVGLRDENRYALYLEDNNRPMVIAGVARISGDAFLPERGIKMGNIQGFGYTKPQLVYGRRQQSSSRLPELYQEVARQLGQLTGLPKGNNISFKKGEIIKNSFQEETQIIRGAVIELENISLVGNILVWASEEIIVQPTANLRDVVLIAPQINIVDGTMGNFQALASKQITMGRNGNLSYPSVLAVGKKGKFEKNANKQQEPSLIMEPGASLSGMLLYWEENDLEGYGANIQIQENANVNGEVYCQGSLELKGNVYGSVTTQSFITLEKGNVYQNHLFGGKIEANLLPLAYGGLVFKDKPANQVMKWLY
ncbi:hypothetical protein [Flagellimonas aequoris]|uniref:Uncharacterized protein n=1 Tax=Flagellimonas aequoris TaxID=2306997 RepID=A0A418N337_9FLAO|nr:hypothetical protein [Allomuricauda aequoris]RIV68265.1 hypothetical protein D2U88_13615 [Allomuricauda aequoris]TXJ99954.1 hypothetical protein FQ019_13465 [Allomuricauda aequoris]